MTGTGTQNDPYIVDNWTDFMTIDTGNSGIYVRWADAENKVIDFNDIQPEGFSTTVVFPANVDFNGWTLRNFHSTASYAIETKVTSQTFMKNLIFENFYVTSSYLFLGGFLLKNCIISGIVQGGSGDRRVFAKCGLQNSSLNIKVNTSGDCSLVANVVAGSGSVCTQIENSDIIIDISCGSSCWICTDIKNSRISGKIQTTASHIYLGDGASMSNVYSIEANKPLEYNGSAVSVYNSDLATVVEDQKSTLIPCTSGQLKNAEYLYNIGFPIGVD